MTQDTAYKLIMFAVLLCIVGLLGFIFLIRYYLVVKPKKAAKQLLKTGGNAVGKLLKSEYTDIKMNNLPYMMLHFDIQAATGEQWQANLKTCLPIHKMYMLTPGTVFNLKYDIHNKMNLALVD
jgi:hypothetical protein